MEQINRTFKLKPGQWAALRAQLMLDYPKMVVLISWRCRETLGFTVREHRDYGSGYRYHLDFWDDGLRTFFVLKYADFLRQKTD
jgi:hypothetical protein